MDQPDITLLKCKSLLTTALSIFLSSSTISIDNEFERLSPWRSPFGLSWPVPETKVYFQMDSEIEQKTRCNFEKFVQHQCWPRNRVAKNRDGTYNLCIFISSFLPLLFFSLSNYQRTELSLFLNSLKILLSAHKQKYFLTFQDIVWPYFGLDFASLQWFFDSFELFKEAQTWRIQGSFLVKTKFFHVIHIDNVLKPSPHGFLAFWSTIVTNYFTSNFWLFDKLVWNMLCIHT